MTGMYAEERHEAIAGLVRSNGRISVSEVASTFGVTTETVRRDLAQLERAGLLRRVHGGAVPTSSLALAEQALDARDVAHAAQKDRIARAASSSSRRRRHRPARRRHDDRPPGRAAADRPRPARHHPRRAAGRRLAGCPGIACRSSAAPSAAAPRPRRRRHRRRRCPTCAPTSSSSAPTP
jgi:DNA-binding transcriptional MocR family regulator